MTINIKMTLSFIGDFVCEISPIAKISVIHNTDLISKIEKKKKELIIMKDK